MSDKAIGIAKAAIAGAFFGGAVGMVSVPKSKKNRKHSVMADVTGTMRIVGSAMQDVSKLLNK